MSQAAGTEEVLSAVAEVSALVEVPVSEEARAWVAESSLAVAKVALSAELPQQEEAAVYRRLAGSNPRLIPSTTTAQCKCKDEWRASDYDAPAFIH